PLLAPLLLNQAFDVGHHPETHDETYLAESTALGSPFPGNRYGQEISMATSFDFPLAVEVLYNFQRMVSSCAIGIDAWEKNNHFT
ncbi:Penicillin-binding protein activator LpoA, partial [Clarias magur]